MKSLNSLNKFKLIQSMVFNGPLIVNIDIVIVYANQWHKHISLSF